MKEAEFYKVVLGVKAPWAIDKVELKVAEKEVHVYIEYNGSAGVCPKCGATASIHDKRVERIWSDCGKCRR